MQLETVALNDPVPSTTYEYTHTVSLGEPEGWSPKPERITEGQGKILDLLRG
jgi:hypothetical protein